MKPNTYTVAITDLRFLLDTFETLEAELEQLQYDEVWFVSDCMDQLKSSIQILHDVLGIKEPDYDDEE